MLRICVYSFTRDAFRNFAGIGESQVSYVAAWHAKQVKLAPVKFQTLPFVRLLLVAYETTNRLVTKQILISWGFKYSILLKK